MARATKERLEHDAERFGLNKPKPSKYDATPCVSCGRQIGSHTRQELNGCAIAARSCSGGGKILVVPKTQAFGQCPDCGQPVVLERQSKSSGTAWFAAHGKREMASVGL